MTIEAKIICDSINQQGNRLTTLQLRYPRFIHPEFMTHRVFSRNASSSRAIPVERMIKDLRRDPAMPVFWGSNKPGMQAGAELNRRSIEDCRMIWLQAMEYNIHMAEALIEHGLHKQIANRLLEPWGHINVVVTATEWENFYLLRRHTDAQPEIHALADAMYEAQLQSSPVLRLPGDWHLPYISNEDTFKAQEFTINGDPLPILCKVSTARCARVSYLTHDGRVTSIEEDLELFNRLMGGQPLHASPAEHQATPDQIINTPWTTSTGHWKNRSKHGNLNGWIQYRKTLPGEFKPG